MYWGADRETTRRQAGKWRGVWGEKENFLPQMPLVLALASFPSSLLTQPKSLEQTITHQEGYQNNNKHKLTYLPFLPTVIVLVSCQRKKTINSQNLCHSFFLHSSPKFLVPSINYMYGTNVMMAIT